VYVVKALKYITPLNWVSLILLPRFRNKYSKIEETRFENRKGENENRKGGEKKEEKIVRSCINAYMPSCEQYTNKVINHFTAITWTLLK
jgi:hypothetical protein